MKRLLICAVAVAGFAGAAAADGMKSTQAAPAPEVSRWAGRYVGAYVGYADGRATHTDLNGYNTFTGISAFQLDDASFVGGLTLGYSIAHGGLLVGLESEYGFLGFSANRQHPGIAVTPGFSANDSRASVKTGFYSTTMARLGVYNDRMLGYIKLGVAWVDTKVSFTDADPFGNTLVSGTKESGMKMGGAVGAGLELALSPTWSAKFEWERIILSDIELVTTAGTGGGTFRFAHDAVFDTLKLGLNYKF